ncbi:hypothetical protein AgCh_028503 [Apium graveolens]
MPPRKSGFTTTCDSSLIVDIDKMVIPPRLKPGRITNFLKPYVPRMHFSNKYISAQGVHTPKASIAFSVKTTTPTASVFRSSSSPPTTAILSSENSTVQRN